MRTDGTVTPEQLARTAAWKGRELIDGVPLERPSSVGCSEVIGHVASLVAAAAQRTGEARGVSSSLGYRGFPHDRHRVRCPRFTLVRSDRYIRLDRDADFMPIPPDLAVDVVAPGKTPESVENRLAGYR